MRLPGGANLYTVSASVLACVCAASLVGRMDQPPAGVAARDAEVLAVQSAERRAVAASFGPERFNQRRSASRERSETAPLASGSPFRRVDPLVSPVSSASSESTESVAENGLPVLPRDGLTTQHVEVCGTIDGSAFSVTEALQQCLDKAPAFSTVELGPGTYVLDRQIVVSKPITIRTGGIAGTRVSCLEQPDRCAILTAAPDLLESFGFLLVHSTSHVTLEHIVLDGNRAARLSSIAARFCLDGQTTAGFNAAILECVGCRLEDVVSRNALCGTGMVWSGGQALIQGNAFVANGDAATPRMWADGLTLLYAPDSEIRWNQFWNNSDVALIIGYGVRTRIEKNVIVQRTQPAFAGIMMHNFGSDELAFRGDFRDAVIADNRIDCGPLLCVFGIQVGPRPWDATKNIVGGDLHENRIDGAKIGINADGAGTSWAPTRIFGNVVSDVPLDAYFSDCPDAIPTTWMNVAPTSFVDRHAEFIETGEHLSERCQLSSAVALNAR